MKTPRILLILAAIMWLVVFKARGADVPVLFIPDYAMSIPKEKEFVPFLLQRGVAPESLRLSIANAPLMRSLEQAGYRKGKTLFAGVYDWRMKIAPGDEEFDGELTAVTAKEITDDHLEFGVDYLGFWLNRILQENPGSDTVDIVTHGAGGLLARAYLQSPAYGATYVDDRGVNRRLPKIRYLILGANPNEGLPESWRLWHGDFQDSLNEGTPATEMEARLAALAFAVVNGGAVIKGPDGDITRESILQADRSGDSTPDEVTFFRRYFPMRQSLMPTLNFLETTEGALTQINEDPDRRSDLLLDLNAVSSDGENPWAKLVVKNAAFQGGVYSIFAPGAREKREIKDFVIPKRVNQNAFVPTITRIKELAENVGDFRPLRPLLSEENPATIPVADSQFERDGDEALAEPLAGDGRVPFDSFLSTFANDPNLTLIQWGNGNAPSDVPANVEWEFQTPFPIYHDVFFYNPEVRQFVVEILTGKRAGQEPVLQKSELGPFAEFVEGHELKPAPEDLRKLDDFLSNGEIRALQKLLQSWRPRDDKQQSSAPSAKAINPSPQRPGPPPRR